MILCRACFIRGFDMLALCPVNSDDAFLMKPINSAYKHNKHEGHV